MPNYAIIEVDAGMTVAEVDENTSAEDAAVRERGVVVDAGPFKSREDAYDAIIALQKAEDADI